MLPSEERGLQQKPNSKVVSFDKGSQSKAYEIFITDHEFYIRTTPQKQFQDFQAIKINRLTSKITEFKGHETEPLFLKEIEEYNIKVREYIDLVMGIIVINSEPYLVLVTEAQSVAILEADRVYQIRATKFIPFKHKFLYQTIDQTENEKIIAFLKQEILKDNFYFCYHEDLTLTRTKRKDKKSTDRKFFWNEYMLGHFKHYHMHSCWKIPVIQGYVREIYCENQYFSFYYAMISRRSREMSGTRFNHRGLDELFNASNFVETEEIFICHNFLFSHVSLRGSVPLFWKQQGVKTDIILKHKLEEDHERGIMEHYGLLQEEYKGAICTINLLSKSKSPEKDLKARFQYYYFRTIKDNNYLHFDLNEEMKDEDGQKMIDQFITAARFVFSGDKGDDPPNENYNFFVMDRFTGKVLCVQKIFSRINCLDCLDRTNVIMARISEYYLESVERFINLRMTIPEKFLKLSKAFHNNLINLWVQLGNRISMIYCGTESVATHMTKRENNSFLSFVSGGIKSINRYYNANVNDSFKHDCVQILLGRKGAASESTFFEENISKNILNELTYCTYDELRFYIMTWNCSMVDPYKLSLKEKQKIFSFLSQEINLVIISLQEIVELNSYNTILGNNENIITEWINAISKCLNDEQINPCLRNSKKNFKLYTNHDMVGMATFVFVSEQIIPKISDFEWVGVKTGLKGNSGHKGAQVFFLKIDSTWVTFINCHLNGGGSKKGDSSSSDRHKDIEFIHNEAIKQRRKRHFFDLSEFKFFVGDMNFGLGYLSAQFVREQLYMIEKRDKEKKLTKVELENLLRPLLKEDEFNRAKVGYLSSYSQPDIFFMPTYKFEAKSKVYDKKKVPSWFDRILYQSADKSKIGVIRYNDIDVYLSDHKPVYAVFNILIKKQNLQKKQQYIKDYLEKDQQP